MAVAPQLPFPRDTRRLQHKDHHHQPGLDDKVVFRRKPGQQDAGVDGLDDQRPQQRRKNRDTKETIADLKKQRDIAAGLLADANLRIVELSNMLAEVQARLEEFQPRTRVLNLPKNGD